MRRHVLGLVGGKLNIWHWYLETGFWSTAGVKAYLQQLWKISYCNSPPV